jgi:hypothetical protein
MLTKQPPVKKTDQKTKQEKKDKKHDVDEKKLEEPEYEPYGFEKIYLIDLFHNKKDCHNDDHHHHQSLEDKVFKHKLVFTEF